ncbi:MAG TPA: GNAT family N-acetyltransferase [Streptosporangiaceae bacterium]|jgi:RimJ/RimL family protein N-acetyltransferase
MTAPDWLPADGLLLTPLAVEDADEMLNVLRGDSLYAFTGGTSPTLGELRDRYQRQVTGQSPDGSEEWRNWIIREPDGTAVGYVQATLTGQGGRADIAWVVGLAWQGRGYAAAAARALVAWLQARGVTDIRASIHPDHRASEAVARRAGLQPTTVLADGERQWRLP